MEEKKLTIGLFNDSFPPFMDGVANTVYNYARCLNKLNTNPVVFTPAVPGYIDREDFEVIRYFSLPMPRRSTYRLGISRLDFSLPKKIKDIHFDILHAHSPFSAGRLALRIAKKKRVPLIATFHSKFYDDFYQETHSRLISKAMLSVVINFFNQCDLVWAVNNATAETLRSYGFKKKIEVAYNGSDFIPPDENEKERLRRIVNEKYKIEPDIPLLLFVGQHIWQKNVRTIIEALDIIKKKNIRFKMIFVGKGDAEEDMRKMVQNLNLVEDVIFAGFMSDREMLKAIYSRSSLFLFPSIYDNAPIVLQEAAACECPGVLVEGSNASEGVKDGYNGFLINNSKESLAEKVILAIKNKELLKEVGRNARNTIFKPWEKVLAEIKERYIEIIKNWR